MTTNKRTSHGTLIWAALGWSFLFSCGPQADLYCQTETLNWLVFYDPANTATAVPFCSDFEVAASMLVDRFSDLYVWDNRLAPKNVEKRLTNVRIVLWEGATQGIEGREYAGIALCPLHSIEIGNVSLPSSSLVHEMLHIAQGCWGQKEGALPENYPGADWGTTGHGGWQADEFYGRIDAINQSIREAIK